MSDVKKVLELIKENDVKYVDFRFTDPKGKWQHTAQHVSTVDEDLLTDGIYFDGSSIAGWKSINEVRHDSEAGRFDRRDRSVRRSDPAGHFLRHRRARHRPAL